MDEINPKVVKQVLRLYMFAHEFALPVIRAFIVHNILDQKAYEDLSDFLQQHMHQIYHLMVKVKCCKCEPLSIISKSGCKITMQQLTKLYNVGQSNMKHFIRSKSGISQQCICGLTVNSSCALKQLDISLIHALLKECASLQYAHMMWLDKINEQRNELCHISDLSKLTESHTQTMWGYLEDSIVGLAKDVPPYPDYMESIERQIKLLKIADYGLNDVRPVIDAMKTEWKAMQSELNNNMNGVLQHQSGKLIDHLEQFFKKFEEQRILGKKETHDHISETATAISAKVEACHSHGKQDLENQTMTLKITIDENQRKQEHLLGAIHKEIIKGNMMSHKTDQVQFDIELSSKTMSMQNHEGTIQHTANKEKDIEKDFVELKISTPGALGEKKEKIKQYLEKAVEFINLAEPFEIKFVRDGCINIGTLLPVDILNNEEEFKRVICNFFDKMVKQCDIDTNIPLVVKVKITVFDTEQQGSVNCFIDEANQTTMTDKAVQAVPTMVDQIIEAKEMEICPTYYDPGQMKTDIDIEKQFLKMIIFSQKISLPVVRTFFVSGVLGRPVYNNDICIFLEYHKHEIFHLVGDYKCCQCTNLPSLQTSSLKFRLGNEQFKKLYDVGLSQPGHFSKGSSGRVFQQCLCCVTVRKETNPKTYDISLLFAILFNCVQLQDNDRLCLDKIRKCRLRLYHLNDITDLSLNELYTMWENLETSVLRLADMIPSQPNYKESIELLVDTFKYADYSRETIAPIKEVIQSEITNKSTKDTQDMLKHVTESAKTIDHTQQGRVHQLSQFHIDETEHHEDMKQAQVGKKDIRQSKLRWSIDIPGYLEEEKDIEKALKKAIEAVNIGTISEG